MPISYSDYRTVTDDDTPSDTLILGERNLHEDPQFADLATNDSHLRSTAGRYDPQTGQFVVDVVNSPAIDTGDPASSYEDFAL